RTAFARGTSVEVRDLFFNVPARLKFQKSAAAETVAATAVVVRVALAHPEVHVTLAVNGRQALACPKASSRRERIGQVFDPAHAERLLEASRREGPVSLEVLAEPPDRHHPTRAEQYLFVNRRPVADRSLQHALLQA